jgi:hypothetical protein
MVAAVVFEVIQERGDQRRVEVGNVQRVRFDAGALLREGQQEPEGVAVGGDRVRAGLSLPDQRFGEERLKRRSQRVHRPALRARAARP